MSSSPHPSQASSIISPEEEPAKQFEYQATEDDESEDTKNHRADRAFEFLLLLQFLRWLSTLRILLLGEFGVAFALFWCLRHCIVWKSKEKGSLFVRKAGKILGGEGLWVE